MNDYKHYNLENEPLTGYKLIQHEYAKFSVRQKPKALLTLTVKEPKGKFGNWKVSDRKLLRSTNRLLHWVNSAMFGRNYKKNRKYLSGFGGLEYQSNEQPHIHLALSSPMPPKLLVKLKKILFEKVKKIALFDVRGIDLKLINDDPQDHYRVGAYVMKGGRSVILDENGII